MQTQTEQSVLGSILIDPNSIHRVSSKLSPNDFVDSRHSKIFERFLTLLYKGEPIDAVTVTANGDIDLAYLVGLTEAVPTSDNIEHYAKIVLDNSQRRELSRICEEILVDTRDQEQSTDELLTRAERNVMAVRRITDTRGVVGVGEAVAGVYSLIQERSEGKGKPVGRGTGIRGLDEITAGLSPSDLIIIAGRPAMGKSALGMTEALNLAEQPDRPVILVFSLEMSREQLIMRLLAQKAKVDAHRLAMGKLDNNEWNRLAKASGELGELNLYIDDDAAISMSKISSICRKFKHERGLHAVFIDYLQLLQADKGGNREQEVANCSRDAKLLAKELDIPVCLLSQLNRACEMRENKRPRISDLRESGSIEQDADEVIFVYRDCVYNDGAPENEAEIIVAKNRDGPIGVVQCHFNQETTAFYE